MMNKWQKLGFFYRGYDDRAIVFLAGCVFTNWPKSIFPRKSTISFGRHVLICRELLELTLLPNTTTSHLSR